MRKAVLTTGMAALALALGAPAHAATIVLGGLAGQCSAQAKAGRSDPEAIDICSRALAGEPLSPRDRAGTYVNRGSMELHERAYGEAHADFQTALKIMPRMGEAHIGEGAYLVSQERFAEAEAEITRGLQLGSEEPEKGYYFRAMARWGQDDFKGAYLDFHKALELKPGWDLPRRQLANFHVAPAH